MEKSQTKTPEPIMAVVRETNEKINVVPGRPGTWNDPTDGRWFHEWQLVFTPLPQSE